MANKPKILFIGIDAADKDLITQWANAGLLPTFQSLFQKAAWGTIENPIGLYVGAIWPSFATSVSAARHRCYCYSQIESGTYRTKQFSVFDLQGELFWDVLSRAGRKVAIIDVPRTPPSENLNGVQVVDWGTHDPDLPDTLYTWPRSLATEVEARFGRDPIGYCNRVNRSADGLKHFRDDLIGRAEKKTQLSQYLLEQDDWDLFMTIYAESHCVGHQCWHIHDPAHPKHNAAIAEEIGDPIQDVYRALDTEIGKLLEQLGPDTTVFVMASHGMGPHYDGTFMLDDILCRLEDVPAPTLRLEVAKALSSSWEQTPGLSALLKPLRRYIWQPLRKVLWKSDKPVRLALQEPDASRRKCFTIPNNDTYGGIRINLVGREPNGKVRPGAEYEAFCQQLTEDLMAIMNVETGQPLVSRVIRTAEHYQGEYLNDLPDLMVEWNREAPVFAVSSAKIGTLEKAFPGVRTGDHCSEGLFFASGPTIKPGQLEQSVSIMDFAPTIAKLLKVPLSGVDGQEITALTHAVVHQ